MSRLAIKTYCAKQLALLTIPVPLIVLIQRPKETEVGDKAVIVVNITSSHEQRWTIPRGQGSKQLHHKLRCDVWWVASDADTGGNSFDQLLDQIDDVFRAMILSLPVTLSDPESAATSNLYLIGEDIETSVNEPILDESLEGYVVFTGDKVYDVWEQVQG